LRFFARLNADEEEEEEGISRAEFRTYLQAESKSDFSLRFTSQIYYTWIFKFETLRHHPRIMTEEKIFSPYIYIPALGAQYLSKFRAEYVTNINNILVRHSLRLFSIRL
jgi:hypothetical protein